MEQEQVITKAVSLYPSDIEIVSSLAEGEHRSFSGAVQFIIREYKRLTADPQPTQPPAPTAPMQASQTKGKRQ